MFIKIIMKDIPGNEVVVDLTGKKFYVDGKTLKIEGDSALERIDIRFDTVDKAIGAYKDLQKVTDTKYVIDTIK